MASAADDKATNSKPAEPSTVPAHPEQWSQEQRDAAEQQEAELFKEYRGDPYSKAKDAIYNFKTACEQRSVDYAYAFLTGNMTAEDYVKVDGARKVLTEYWRRVGKLYRGCKLACDGGDFFSPNKRWLRMGTSFRALVEPLDIANWYKCDNHVKGSGSGHYLEAIAKGEDGKRPTHYALLDRLAKEALLAGNPNYTNYVDSVGKAVVFKDEVVQGHVKIQKIGDARADPPRGFLRLSPVSPGSVLQLRPNRPDESGSVLPPQPDHQVLPPTIEVPDTIKNTPLNSATPTSVIGPNAPTPDVTPTPAAEAVRTRLEDLSMDKTATDVSGSTLPEWKDGVRFRCKAGNFMATRRALPEPTIATAKVPIRPGKAWNEEQRTSGEIKVDYNTLVYETPSNKYLVVRAKILANVNLTHADKQRCGYFQESLEFSMDVPGGSPKISPGTFPLVPKDPVYDRKNTRKKGKQTSVVATGKAQVSKTGPSGEAAINVGQTWTQEHAAESAYKSEPVRMHFTTDEGKLTWKWTVYLLEDGSYYDDRQLDEKKRLPRLSNFATTSVSLEVQGTWSFSKDARDPVVLKVSVGQTLKYDVLVESWFSRWTGIRACNTLQTSDPVQCDSNNGGVLVTLEMDGQPSEVNNRGKKLPECFA